MARKAKRKGKNVNVDIKCGGCKCKSSKGCMGCFYFLGFIGAAVYYIQVATGFWAGVLGLLKALVWPAFLVFELLKMVGA